MLIITRKIGEELVIRDDVRVVILGVNGQQVKIGIEAPKEVPVIRGELIAGASPPGTRSDQP